MGKDLQSSRRVALLALFGALAVALCTARPVFAQSAQDKKKALEHFEQGEAYMKVQAYDKAAKEYLAAYEAVPKPGFLFNIGLAYMSANEMRPALDYFQCYLKLDPNGRASVEARAYVARLEEKLAAEEAAAAEVARKQREVEEKKAEARSRADAAATYRKAGEYARAEAELRAALAADPDPEYVYQLAEVYRLAKDRSRAVVEYERYRSMAPAGAHSPDALEKITKLKLEIEEAARPKPQPAAGLVDPTAGVAEKKQKKGGIAWHWLAIGAAAIAAGVVADVAPSNASNGELDGTDFFPVGLYGVGGLFLIAGVF